MSAPNIVPHRLKPLLPGASQEGTSTFFVAILFNINTTTATLNKISHLEANVATMENKVAVLKKELRVVKESVN
jgi:hypothetical protein